MRDQMDRFGEIDKTAKLIQKVVENTTEFVVLNRDDVRVSKLSEYAKGQVFYFGVSPSLRPLYLNDDELHETTPPKLSKQKAIAELLEIKKGDKIVIKLNESEYQIAMVASSSFNYQNAVAICAAAIAVGIDSEVIVDRLKEVKPAFGRGEGILIGSKIVTLQLVKNPGGFRHALHSLSTKKTNCCMIAINDDYADGRDVSWLWDVDFRSHINQKAYPIYVSGTRAADMALRLKYDGIKITTSLPVLDECLDIALKYTPNKGHLLIFTTYTAMLHLRKALAKLTEVETI
jgi:UDP-N-acetylmuramyl tripeptide synthase